jgi:hypothetical protein
VWCVDAKNGGAASTATAVIRRKMDVGEAYQILNLERSVVNKAEIEEVRLTWEGDSVCVCVCVCVVGLAGPLRPGTLCRGFPASITQNHLQNIMHFAYYITGI